ncbi:MAG: enoyl-CoA hydratase-related protein [Pseudomonadota bacterium]
MSTEPVILEKSQRIVTLIFNRPDVHNAMNVEMADGLDRALTDIEKDREIRALILTGAGDRSFMSGADINEMLKRTPLTAVESSIYRQGLFDRLAGLPIPSIAALNGYTFGIGSELALACTFRIASAKAKLGQLEINIGIIPGAGGTQRLLRLIGKSKASELILSGRVIGADEALALGVVNKVVPPEELMDECLRWAGDFAQKSPVAMKYALQAINQGAEVDLARGLKIESYCIGVCFSSQDAKEGVRAFLEKRKPNYSGD